MNNELSNRLLNFLSTQYPINANSGVAFASAARTATSSSANIKNYGNQGIVVTLDTTVVNTSSFTLTIEGKDPASGKYYTILTSAAVSTVSTNHYRVNPLLTAAANTIAKDMVPAVFRITMTHSNANSTTYSVGYNLA